MKEQLEKLIGDKKLLILGFGKEGQATYQLLRKYFPSKMLAIADENENLKEKIQSLNDQFLNIYLGESFKNYLNDYDLIFKTPGIPFKKIKDFVSPQKITSQTDLFLRLFSQQIIGITGTKGKSTTSSLIYHILKLFTEDVVFVGNIGIPHFEMIDKIGKNTKIVCELSSHQLEFISKAPSIAVLLNLYQEHLDHYESLEQYHLSKINILKYQNENDYFIYNADEPSINQYLQKLNVKRNFFEYSLKGKIENGCYLDNRKIIFKINNQKKIFDIDEHRLIKGDHNLLNIMAAINVCQILNIPDEIIINGIKTFKGLPHRLEYVGKYNDIHFYNDSIATIPEATIQAVKSLGNVNTLILGGYDRGIDYSGLTDFLNQSTINNLIFLDEAGKRIMEELKNKKSFKGNVYFVKDMEEAVKISMQVTEKNLICLLSPAAASYGMFKDFAERGDLFKKTIRSTE